MRRILPVVLFLALAAPAHATLEKKACAARQTIIAGRLFARVAKCYARNQYLEGGTSPFPCMEEALDRWEATSDALEADGCRPWFTRAELAARAFGTLVSPPQGFWDDCEEVEGQCQGSCVVGSFHMCARLDDGGCGCVLPPDF